MTTGANWWIDSIFSFPRLTAARTRLGSAVQTKGLGLELVSSTNRCSLKVDNRPEHSTLEAPSREFGEEAFDGVEPGRRGRREVEMPGQPSLYLGMFVGRVVVDDGVDRIRTGT